MPNRKPDSLIPANDQKRLEKLHEFEILGTYSEIEFDRIAQLAADIFDCPAALITFVDSDKVFFKSNLSEIEVNEVPRKDSLCSLTILEQKVTVIEDASQYDDLMESPFVCQPKGIKFYAGAPLTTSDGYRLGSICVIDDKPRKATDRQLNILNELSKLVMEKLENRLATKKIITVHTEYINRSVHDLKNYVGTLMIATDLLEKSNLEKEFKALPAIINRNTKQISDRLNNMLNLSRIEGAAYTLSIRPCKISELLDHIVANYSTSINAKGQKVVKNYKPDIIFNADHNAISEIFENLLSNALKYSFPNAEIIITSDEDKDNFVFGFHDHGQGLTEKDMGKLFVRYAKLSSVPTAKETSTGVGLTITKILTELHQGKIWAESKGKNEGASFYVSFPKHFDLSPDM